MDPISALEWLESNPRLEALMERYPEVWRQAGAELMEAGKTGMGERINEFAMKVKATADIWKTRINKSGSNPKVIEAAVPHIVKSRMIMLCYERGYLAAAAGKTTGKVRFNLFNGLIIQKLLFERQLKRKPASMRWVRLLWPFLWQRRLLLPLVQDKGIYCFYSKELVRALADMIGSRSCLEIAAGDGTLSRFLTDAGVHVRATDDRSWKHAVAYPDEVEALDAKSALQKYRPETVVCSFPPPGNGFEKQVFVTPSVQLYVVIGSRHRFVSGNWDDYEKQTQFDWATGEALSRLVIPPDSGFAVLVFRRKSAHD